MSFTDPEFTALPNQETDHTTLDLFPPSLGPVLPSTEDPFQPTLPDTNIDPVITPAASTPPSASPQEALHSLLSLPCGSQNPTTSTSALTIRRTNIYLDSSFLSSSITSNTNNSFRPSPILLTYPPVDWSDTFTLPFHIEIEKDPAKWKFLESSFLQIRSHNDLHVWLAIRVKQNLTAFLFSDRHHRPSLIHNLTISPDSGTTAFPDIEFLALQKSDFSSPSISIDDQDIPSVFTSSLYKHVPSALEILTNCVVPNPYLDASSHFGFHFNPQRFSELTPDPSEYDNDTNHIFLSSSILLLPPSLHIRKNHTTPQPHNTTPS